MPDNKKAQFSATNAAAAEKNLSCSQHREREGESEKGREVESEREEELA